MESNWQCPVQFGYIIAKDKDFGTYSMVRCSEISSNLEKIYGFFETKVPISYKDERGSKSHGTVLFYGSKSKCSSLLKTINTVDGKKSDPVVVDLTGSPKSRKKLKTEHGSNSDSGDVTISRDNLNIKEILSRLNSVEKAVNNLKNCTQEILRKHYDLEEKIMTMDSAKEAEEKSLITNNKIMVKELEIQFAKLLLTKRSSKQWNQSVKSMVIPGVNSKQEKEIKRLLMTGSDQPGSFLRSLGRALFGEERIKETLLGDDGNFLRGVPSTGRHQVFTVEEELKLINTLKIIDKEFFSSRDVYKHLIRCKINSFGNDLKRNETSSPRRFTKFNSRTSCPYFLD